MLIMESIFTSINISNFLNSVFNIGIAIIGIFLVFKVIDIAKHHLSLLDEPPYYAPNNSTLDNYFDTFGDSPELNDHLQQDFTHDPHAYLLSSDRILRDESVEALYFTPDFSDSLPVDEALEAEYDRFSEAYQEHLNAAKHPEDKDLHDYALELRQGKDLETWFVENQDFINRYHSEWGGEFYHLDMQDDD